MINIKPYQETLGQGVCGPAVLKMLLMYFDLEAGNKSDMELAKACGTNNLGTTTTQLTKAIRSFGLKCDEKFNSEFEDIEMALKRGNPVIVDWFTPGRKDESDSEMPDGHYSIVVDLDENNIYLQDPGIGKMRTIPRDSFYRVWFDFDEPNSDYIKDTKNVFLRYMAEVSKENLKVQASY